MSSGAAAQKSPPEKAAPDMQMRRALQGKWEPASDVAAMCNGCAMLAVVNVLGICQACNYREKIATLTVIAEPWALKEVRRQYGISGETNPWDTYRKQLKAEAMEEAVEKAKGAMTNEEFRAKMAASGLN